jgi:hypothetical protein
MESAKRVVEEEVECRRRVIVIVVVLWLVHVHGMDAGGARLRSTHNQAPAKGEPRVNTDDKTVREAVFWNPSPWNNGYNCFRPFLLSSSFLSLDSNTCCWHAIVPLLLLDTRTLADMQQGL